MDATKFSKTKQVELQKRLKRLEKIFNQDPSGFTQRNDSEVKQIEKILLSLEHVNQQLEAVEKVKHSVSVSNSKEEEWYRAMFAQWMLTHETIEKNSLNGPSAIYKFALHFFVDNVVLNPKNSGMNYEELTSNFRSMNETSEVEKRIQFALDDLTLMTSFIASMQLEVNDQDLNSPLRKFGLDQVDTLSTDVDGQNKLGIALDEYKQMRSEDKLKKKQGHNTLEWR